MRTFKFLAALSSMAMALVYAGFAWANNPTTYYTTVTKTANFSTAQTDTALWTPATGKRFILQGCAISSINAVAVKLEVSDVAVIPDIYVTSMGTVIIGGSEAPIYVSAKNAVLTYTTLPTLVSPTHKNVSIMCWGWEEPV